MAEEDGENTAVDEDLEAAPVEAEDKPGESDSTEEGEPADEWAGIIQMAKDAGMTPADLQNDAALGFQARQDQEQRMWAEHNKDPNAPNAPNAPAPAATPSDDGGVPDDDEPVTAKQLDARFAQQRNADIDEAQLEALSISDPVKIGVLRAGVEHLQKQHPKIRRAAIWKEVKRSVGLTPEQPASDPAPDNKATVTKIKKASDRSNTRRASRGTQTSAPSADSDSAIDPLSDEALAEQHKRYGTERAVR